MKPRKSSVASYIMAVMLMGGMVSVYADLLVQEWEPVADGMVVDVGPEVGSPRDGIADYVSDASSMSVNINDLHESRGITEFVLGSITPQSVRSASLVLIPIGKSWWQSATSIAFQLYRFNGDGALSVDDFYQGDLITQFDVPIYFPAGQPFRVDVTDALRNMADINSVAFKIRRNPEDTIGSVNFGSLDYPPGTTLVVTYSDCIENHPRSTLTSIGGGQSRPVNATLETVITGHITTEKGLTSRKRDSLNLCRGTEADYIVTTSVGSAVCTLNGADAALSGVLQEGDILSCNNEPQGGDTDTFSVSASD